MTGNIDEKVRHAITKLADYHFVASEEARDRVIKLGEKKEVVFNTGCPSIDIAAEVLAKPDLDFNPFSKYGGVGVNLNLEEKYIVVMQHPVANEYEQSRIHIEETLHAINELAVPTFWFWPNVDAGADGTSKGIRVFRENNDLKHIHFFKNMESEDFLRLLVNSSCLVGNSSVGIRECAYLGVPVVNIGSRQNRRQRGDNVVDAKYNRVNIKSSVIEWLNSKRPQKSLIYGNGDAGKQISILLESLPLQFYKTISY